MPEFVPQLIPRNDVPGMLQKTGKYTEGLVLQLNPDSVLAQFSGSEINFKHAKA